MMDRVRLNRRQGLLAAAAVVGGLGVVGSAQAAVTFPVRGVVRAEDGAPISGARVTDGVELAVADIDGVFHFSAGQLEGATELRISASGYRDRVLAADEVSDNLDVQLERRQINALYLNPAVSTLLDDYDALIEVINSTNANAVVLDIKEEWVWYDTEVEFFHDAGSVVPMYDLAKILAKFRENNIYTIARLVVFKDSFVASSRPDLAIRNSVTGEPWRDQNGVAWVNPLKEELWEPNIALAVEAANAGFDEIQYDYIRFPTDGDLTTMDFGVELTQQAREEAIESFLMESRQRLLPTGAKQAADLFGFTMVIDDDLGIGQNFAQLAAHLDYLCPMVYPSHYSEFQFGLPGHPNDYPYDVVAISLEGGVARANGNALQIRPWLQDFTYPEMNAYGPPEVRAQIQAASDFGTSGWMLWDPGQIFSLANLDASEPSDIPNPENAP